MWYTIYMNMRAAYILHIYMAGAIAGAGFLPLAAHAFSIDDLRRMHEQSIEQRDAQREQFRQDVLERRKEFFLKWGDRKQGIKDKFKADQERIRAEFKTRRPDEEIMQTATSSVSTTTEQEHIEEPKQDLFFVIQKQANGFFQKISSLFGN